jgi:hypothetical protein
MLKHFIIIFLIASSCKPLVAQVQWGVMLSPGVSSFQSFAESGNVEEVVMSQKISHFGGFMGPFASFPISPTVNINTSLLLSKRSFDYAFQRSSNDTSVVYNDQYPAEDFFNTYSLHVPIDLKLYNDSILAKNRFYFNFGFYTEYFIASDVKYEAGPMHSFMDGGVALGIGDEFSLSPTLHLVFEIRFTKGFGNVISKNNVIRNDGGMVVNQDMFSFTIGLKFGPNKYKRFEAKGIDENLIEDHPDDVLPGPEDEF